MVSIVSANIFSSEKWVAFFCGFTKQSKLDLFNF